MSASVRGHMLSRAQVQQLLNNLLELGPRRLMALGLIGFAVLVTVVGGAYYLSRPEFETLYTGLSREDRRSGQLEQPFDVIVDPGAAYYLTRPSARPMSRSLALFWDWILDEVDLDPFA